MLRDLLKVTKGDITFLLQKNNNIFTRFYLGNPYACKTLGTYLAWQLRSQASTKSKQVSGVFSWDRLHSEELCCLPQNRVTRFYITISVSKYWWVRHSGNGACSYFPLLEWDFCCSQNGKAKHSLGYKLVWICSTNIWQENLQLNCQSLSKESPEQRPQSLPI